jgi:Xaa-Pro aminopeptidase
MDFYRTRRSGMLRFAKADEVDTYLITAPTNIHYLSGRRTADALVIGAKGGVVVGGAAADDDLTAFPVKAGAKPEQAIAEAIQKLGAKAVGVEAGGCPVGLFQKLTAALPKVSFKAVADRPEGMRAVKDPSEVEHLRKAVRVAERAYVMFRAVMRETETEIDLGHLMDRFVRQAGAAASAVPATVSLGENGGDPNHVPTDKQLGEVSKALVLWGADVGYCSVLARAFRSPFEPQLLRKTKQERTGFPFEKVTAAVKDAHKAALAKVKPGGTAVEVAAAAHAALAAAGYADYAGYEVGHGVGLLPREAPFLSAANPTELISGMVLAVAPEVRMAGWGGVKHGTCVMVTRDGYTDLTSGPAEFRD